MSRIPKNAMPHAEAGEDVDLRNPETGSDEPETVVGELRSAFGQLAEKVREHPGIAAAGAAAVVGAATAAAVIPAIRGRSRKSGGTTAKSSGAGSKGGRGKAKKKS